MPATLKDMLGSANAVVPQVSAAEARRLIEERNALVLDVRDPAEVATSGKIRGALNVPRGMLEFRADPETSYHDAAFAKDRPVVIYCGSGARAALGGKVLKDMGYGEVHNLGAFKDWAEGGGETEPA